MLYNIVTVSAIHQDDSAPGIHTSLSLLNLSPLPSHPTPPGRVTEQGFGFPATNSKFPLAIYFAYGNICFDTTLSSLQQLSILYKSLDLGSHSLSPLAYILINKRV